MSVLVFSDDVLFTLRIVQAINVFVVLDSTCLILGHKGNSKQKNACKMRICFHYLVNFYKTADANFTYAGNTLCATVKHLIKKDFPALLNLTKSGARFWKLKPSRKCTRVFLACAD